VANGLQISFSPNNFGAFTSGTLTITGVQLEAGSVATPFEFKSVGDTFMLCQRYYQTGSFGVFNYTTGGTQLAYQQPFPVQMRASPSMTQPTATAVNVTSYTLYPGSASFQVYCVGVAASGGAYYGTYTASAEL
jgi:hypothetical protein